MIEKIYLDSNVFIFAATNTEIEGNAARDILNKIKNEEMEGITSILTLDEVLWVVQKLTNRETAHTITSTLLTFPNLTLVDATKEIVANALSFYQKEHVQPRDAVHLATMHFKNTTTIVSNDSDFEKIKGIKRMRLK